jgi:DNA-binding LytR/AlgR family response regulator
VDDEQHAIDILKSHIEKVASLELILATTDSVEAFHFVQKNEVDLIFLDIEMSDLSGLDFLRLLKEKSKVILTTAYREHALDGFEYNVIDYLLKPVLLPRFLKAVNRMLNSDIQKDEAVNDFIFVKTGIRNKVVKVEFNKIIYIESMGNYVHFVLKNNKISCLMPLKEVDKMLPVNQFMRIHQSFIVRKQHIIGREGNQIILENIMLPIGESYKKQVLEYFK